MVGAVMAYVHIERVGHLHRNISRTVPFLRHGP